MIPFKVHILGSGTCTPDSERGSSGYAVILEKSKIILDCGNGTTWKLKKAGIDYLDIDFIFITHLHPDHTSDLIPFLFGTKYNPERKREKPLSLFGPPGFKEFFQKLNQLHNNWISFEELQVLDLKEPSLHFEDFTLSWIKTPHTENSVAYRITSHEKTLVYTGDTDYDESLAHFSKNADLLIIECSTPNELKVKGHLTPAEVSRLVSLATPSKTVITHIFPACEKINPADLIKRKTGLEIIEAKDMMIVEL